MPISPLRPRSTILTLVSFDADFDRTERGRKTPADVLKEPQKTPEDKGDR